MKSVDRIQALNTLKPMLNRGYISFCELACNIHYAHKKKPALGGAL
jgi:hypothetical protein